MFVRINTVNLPGDHGQSIYEEAAQLVRLDFNPSAKPEVEVIKSLSAALISACDEIARANPDAGRHAALAKTAAEEAAMWGVKAATTEPSEDGRQPAEEGQPNPA